MYTTRPAEFEYHRPSSLAEAVSLLGGEARPLAGGHSLLPLMKLHVTAPSALVDLSGIPGLDGIAGDAHSVTVGAMATHEAVADSGAVNAACPVLADCAGGIGDRQVRNRGTIGGSIAHADPGADYPTVLTALGATILVTGPGGDREVAADDFFRGVFATALEPGELVKAVRVPGTPPGTGAAYLKKKHPASGYAVVGAAAVVNGDGQKVVVGGVAGKPVAAGDPGSLDFGSNLIGDSYASSEYRVHLAGVLARRAIAAARAAAS